MLNFFRKNTKTIIWIVVIAFIAWGGFAVSVQFEETLRSPGKIFGKEVSFRHYLLARRAVQIFTPSADKENPPDFNQMEARTWEFLVLSHEAKRRKITVNDEEVRQEITQLLAESGAQGLRQDQYARWIQATFREQPREFEDQLREQMRIRKLINEIRQSPQGSSEEDLKRWLLALLTQAKIQVYKPRS
mgnify:CR=1 FL=1